MKIYFHPYKLKTMGSWNQIQRPHPCEGALLKIDYGQGKIGYSDLHPWPTLGDKKLTEQLAIIHSGGLTFQAEQSIWMAARDAALRFKKMSVDFKKSSIQNHLFLNESILATDTLLKESWDLGYRKVKLKAGNDLDKEAEFLNLMSDKFEFFWRLDFNSKLDVYSFGKFWQKLSAQAKKKLEFVEDPTPYDEFDWGQINRFVPVALDRDYEKVNFNDQSIERCFQVIVVKPAVQDPEPAIQLCEKEGLKMVITTYLDHPVGNAHAAWIATEVKERINDKLLDCGLLSLRAYAYSDFTSFLTIEGPSLIKSQGHGIGFDIMFERVEWKLLKG